MSNGEVEKATVLAYEKKLVPSDGWMYGTTWEAREQTVRGLKLVEKSVRGTISNRLPSKISSDPLKLNAEVEKANLQTVDSCALGMEEDTLKLTFTLKVLSGVEYPSACNSTSFYEKYTKVARRYIDTYGFSELAHRYAVNLANARFLWRNRLGVEDAEVHIMHCYDDKKSWKFDPFELSTRSFDHHENGVDELSAIIAAALSGTIPFALFEVTAFAKVGMGQDVYPSEELVLDKGNSKKSKILYAVDGTAALHSQKIGNAIRTVDTWYPDYENVPTGPIALEPYGSVTNLGIAYRNPGTKSDFYTLFDRYARGESLPTVEDEHYVMGVLVRGGVFGESNK